MEQDLAQETDKLQISEQQSPQPTGALRFNPSAASFVPNAAAAPFVPSFGAAAVPKTEESPKPKKTPASSVAATDKLKRSESASSVNNGAMQLDTEEDQLAAEEFFTDGEKEHFNIVFIGHVGNNYACFRKLIQTDAGKSTMGGHILLLTGVVDKRTMEKYEKEAKEQNRETWYLSWALDTNEDERAKGKTVECGRGFFETDKRRFTILDAPGHKNYVPNMISGASQADIGILVISARRGEFETGFEKGGQTREHAMLAKTAGVKHLIVAINKMDDSTVNWEKERYDECCDKLLPFLKQCGYNPKVDLDFLPVSGYSGANLKDRVDKNVCPWFDGPSLLELLDNISGIDRKPTGPFMMPISEKYRDMGTVVCGKVESGGIKKGMSVVIMPNKKVCEVLGVYSELEEEVKSAICGDNIRLKLKGVEEEDISRGFVVCSPKKTVQTCVAFEAQLMILDCKNIITNGYSAVLHVHTRVEEVILDQLIALVEKKTGRKSKRPPISVKKGQIAIARLTTTGPICLETYADYPQLGRFTIRDEGKTIAMGKVTRLIDPN